MRFLATNGWLMAAVFLIVAWIVMGLVPAATDCSARHGVLVRGFSLSGLACVAPPGATRQ